MRWPFLSRFSLEFLWTNFSEGKGEPDRRLCLVYPLSLTGDTWSQCFRPRAFSVGVKNGVVQYLRSNQLIVCLFVCLFVCWVACVCWNQSSSNIWAVNPSPVQVKWQERLSQSQLFIIACLMTTTCVHRWPRIPILRQKYRLSKNQTFQWRKNKSGDG